ncbi:MAG: peptidase S1 [Acidobacteria bacterium]|nr:MAG: peptidase S1 [Acidobacteriota bacterium]
MPPQPLAKPICLSIPISQPYDLFRKSRPLPLPSRWALVALSVALVAHPALARAQPVFKPAQPTLAQPSLAQPTSPTDALTQFNDSVQALVRRVSPSVVQVLVTSYAPIERSDPGDADALVGTQRSIGSGVVIDSDGYVITNAHVVSGARQISVVLAGAGPSELSERRPSGVLGRTRPARVVGMSPELDLALLKIEETRLPALSFASPDRVRQGQLVFAFGSPEGFRNSVTMGVVSATARQLDPDSALVYIQTDAPINHGNSGGPLVDVEGNIVGINTFIVSASGGSQGLGFAIPSSVVQMAGEQLRRYGRLVPGEIGIHLQTITPDLAQGLGLARDWGVVVSNVLPGGPAAVAGVKIQDVVLAADGSAIDDLPSLALHLITRHVGDRVTLSVLRGDQTLALNVLVVERPQSVTRSSSFADPRATLVTELGVLALEVDDLNDADQHAPSGVLVVARVPSLRATDVALSAGDVICALNGSAVSTLADLQAAISRVQPGGAIALQVLRDGQFQFVAFRLG